MPQTSVAVILAAKTVRTFYYGFLGILLPIYLSELGVSAAGVGIALTCTLVGSAVLTWAVRRPAERWGTRGALIGLGALSAVAATLLLSSSHPIAVVAAAMLGNVAVGTGETGPFLSLEQVVLARSIGAERRTFVLSVYNLVGYAAGALGAGAVSTLSTRALFVTFLLGAVFQLVCYLQLVDRPGPARPVDAVGLSSAPFIRRLAAVFALDSFAGGFVLQALIALYLHRQYGLDLDDLGRVFFGAQLVTAASLLLAAPLARRFGLLRTMVITHLVSNVMLIAMAAAPTATLAVVLLYLRQLLSQIDVPTRQAYVMAVVADHEREAAAVTTTLARTVAQAITPAATGWVMQTVALGAPFVLGGGLKIVYDLLLYLMLRNVKLPSERAGDS
jgi:MFS family permease